MRKHLLRRQKQNKTLDSEWRGRMPSPTKIQAHAAQLRGNYRNPFVDKMGDSASRKYLTPVDPGNADMCIYTYKNVVGTSSFTKGLHLHFTNGQAYAPPPPFSLSLSCIDKKNE